MNFYKRQKLGIVSAIFIAFFCSSMSAIFVQNAEAVCDELRKEKNHAAGHVETAELAHAAAAAILGSATARRTVNEAFLGKKEPSDATLAELAAIELAMYLILEMERADYEAAERAYANCLILNRHSCGCPITTHSQTSCGCSRMRSGYYGYGVNCPCYDSSP